jgi:hypothetical protein
MIFRILIDFLFVSGELPTFLDSTEHIRRDPSWKLLPVTNPVSDPKIFLDIEYKNIIHSYHHRSFDRKVPFINGLWMLFAGAFLI